MVFVTVCAEKGRLLRQITEGLVSHPTRLWLHVTVRMSEFDTWYMLDLNTQSLPGKIQ